MKAVYVGLIILFLIAIIIVLYRPRFRIMVVLSGGTKSAYYAFRHKLFDLERGKIIILDDGSISVVNKKSVLLEKPIPKKLMILIIEKLWGALKIKKLKIYSSVQDTGMIPALVTGALVSVSGIIDAINNSLKTDVVSLGVTKSRERASVAVSSVIKLSLIKIIISIISAKIEYKKSLKEKKYAKANK